MEKELFDLKRSRSEPPVMNSVTIMKGWCLVTAPRNCTCRGIVRFDWLSWDTEDDPCCQIKAAGIASPCRSRSRSGGICSLTVCVWCTLSKTFSSVLKSPMATAPVSLRILTATTVPCQRALWTTPNSPSPKRPRLVLNDKRMACNYEICLDVRA